MAVLVADSLLEPGGLDPADIFERFRRWAAGDPKDIGLQTEAVLTSGDPWDSAAGQYFWITGRAAGNGSLMRASTSAVYFAFAGREATMRTTADYESAVRAAVDLGGDTDTVAAVTGGLAGAVYGMEAIPARWTEPLHVPVPGWGDRVLRCADLVAMAEKLAGPRMRPGRL